MDEARAQVEAVPAVATQACEVTEPSAIEYSPITGWLLIAIGLVSCGLLVRTLTGDHRLKSLEPSGAARFAVDINRATVEELQILPRVGPALAGRIVEYVRQHGQVASLEQLNEIRGVGLR